MSAVTLNYLTTTQPNVGGTTIKVTTTTKMVSFNYIIFPGDNAGSSGSGAPFNSLINYTVLVGSDDCTLIDTTGSTYTYSLFVCWGETLCAADYYVVVSGLQLDGTYTPYQTTPLTLYLAPDTIVINSTDAYITRSGYAYTDATVTVLFDISGCIYFDYSNEITYNVAIQYVDGNGDLQFYTSEVSYTPDIISGRGGVQVFIDTPNSGVTEDVYVAVQPIRNVSLSSSLTYKAIAEISNTVKALDTEKPQPPTNLTLVSYEYWLDTANLSWLAPASASYINVDNFKLYRKVGSGSFTLLATIPYVSGQSVYTYADTTLTQPAGTAISYYVTSQNEDGESPPSNTVSLTIIIESSAPRNLSAGGLLEPTSPVEGDIICAFEPPTDICGNLVCDYETAYFQLNVYDPSGSLTVPIGSSQVPYVAGQTAYTGHVSGFTVNSSTEKTVILEVYLVTFSPYNGDPCYDVHGQSATTNVVLTLTPLIWDINGQGVTAEGLTFEVTRKLSTFKVSTYTTLLPLSVYIGVHDTGSKTLINRVLTIPTPTISGSSDPLPGSYTYEFTVPSEVVTAIKYGVTVQGSNISGPGRRTMLGIIY